MKTDRSVTVLWAIVFSCVVSTAELAWATQPQVATGYYHTIGVKSNGTVVAIGRNVEGQCNVSGWTGIVQVAAGEVHTVGRKSDGAVAATGDNTQGQCNVSGWSLEGWPTQKGIPPAIPLLLLDN